MSHKHLQEIELGECYRVRLLAKDSLDASERITRLTRVNYLLIATCSSDRIQQ
jgi:hypothetical protein